MYSKYLRPQLQTVDPKLTLRVGGNVSGLRKSHPSMHNALKEEDPEEADNTLASKNKPRLSELTEKKWADWINFYDLIDQKARRKYYNPNAERLGIEHPFRMGVVGSTGAGKTNFLLNLIKQVDCFDEVIVFCAMPDEPLYKWLKEHFHGKITITDKLDKLPEMNEYDEDREEQGLLVFDDVIGMPSSVQARIAKYFIAMRKINFSGVFISQSYFRIPIVVRQQLSQIVILNTSSEQDFKRIASEYSFTADIKGMYNAARNDRTPAHPNGTFFWINVGKQDNDGRFRCGFDGEFDLADYVNAASQPRVMKRKLE